MKYCISHFPQTFIILKRRLLMHRAVKTGSVWLKFQGNRGRSESLHQYPRWQVSHISLGLFTSGFMDQNVFHFFTKDIILAIKCTRHRGAIKSCRLHLECAAHTDFVFIKSFDYSGLITLSDSRRQK